MRIIVLFSIFAALQFSSVAQQNPAYQIDTFPIINTWIAQVDTMLIKEHAQHLQDYGTRFCTQPQSFQAQDWIKQQYQGYGLSVELQDFPTTWGNSSDNVIATKTGVLLPDEYVIIGAHYDDLASITQAPGADDNASGTSGVMEVARILSQYQFERTIIFCAFSAEEIGLVGSEAYVTRCEQQGMNILGYFNMDMIGYHSPGDLLHSDMIAPASAQPLVVFYEGVANIFLPDFPYFVAGPINGDSDHTSFNNHGYMGIFPFEDVPNYSPYIHTTSDVMGLSFNSALLASKLTKAGLAATATLAIPYDPTATHNLTPHGIVSVFPNPAKGFVTVSSTAPDASHAAIMNLNGQILWENDFSGKTRADLSGLPRGTYIVKVVSDNSVEIKKLILQ